MEKLSKMPISKLIFYETYPDLTSYSVDDITQSITERLTRKYKLYPNDASKFIQKEREITLKRGNNIEKYFYNPEMSFSQFLDLLYNVFDYENTYLDSRSDFLLMELKLVEFTFSEKLFMSVVVNNFASLKHKKVSQIDSEIKKNKRQEKQVLNKTLSLDGKTEEINRLTQARMDLVSLKDKYLIQENVYKSICQKFIEDIIHSLLFTESFSEGNLKSLLSVHTIILKEYLKKYVKLVYNDSVEEEFYQKVKDNSKKR